MPSDEDQQSDAAEQMRSPSPPSGDLPSESVESPSQPSAPPSQLFTFGQVLGGVLAVIAVAFTAKGAGWSRGQTITVLVCILIIAAMAKSVYLAYETRFNQWSSIGRTAVGASALILLVLEFFFAWPFGAQSPAAGPGEASKMTSCNTATLLKPPAVTSDETKSPLMYKAVSTDTLPNSHTAVAHEIYPSGWMQQVFLATRQNVEVVSAIISTHVSPRPALPIIFEVRTLSGHILRPIINAKYNGSTDNRDFVNSFEKPVPVTVGNLYVLRVINDSRSNVYMYAHYYDNAQVVPYPVPGCEHNSGDGGAYDFTMLDNRGFQVLSGVIESSGG